MDADVLHEQVLGVLVGHIGDGGISRQHHHPFFEGLVVEVRVDLLAVEAGGARGGDRGKGESGKAK